MENTHVKPKAQFLQSKTSPETEPEQNSTAGGDSCFRLRQNWHLINYSIPSVLSAGSVTALGCSWQDGSPGVPGLPAAGAVGTLPLLVVLADGGGFAGGQVMGEQALASLPTHALQVVPVERRRRNALVEFGSVSQNHRGWRSPPSPPSCARPPRCPSPEHSMAIPRDGDPDPPRAALSSEQNFPEETRRSFSMLTPLVSRAPRGAGTPSSLRGGDKGGSGVSATSSSARAGPARSVGGVRAE